MQVLRRFAWAALLLLSVATAQAEVSREDARALMERNGMVAQLADDADQLREMLPKEMDGILPPDLAKAITEIVAEAWEKENLTEAIEAALADALTVGDIDAANAFFGSSLGRRIVDAETLADTTEAWREFQTKREEFAASLETDKERLAIARRIDKALRTTDLNAALSLSLLRAVMFGGSASADADTIAGIEQVIEQMRPEIIKETRIDTLAQFAQTYGDFSLDELRAYADYLETDSARTINGVDFAVVNEHFVAVGGAMGEGMVVLLRQKRS